MLGRIWASRQVWNFGILPVYMPRQGVHRPTQPLAFEADQHATIPSTSQNHSGDNTGATERTRRFKGVAAEPSGTVKHQRPWVSGRFQVGEITTL